MSKIRVSRLVCDKNYPDLAVVSGQLDNLSHSNNIDRVNWIKYPYKPSVRFNIAYNDREIFIRFDVREDRVKAEMTEDNQRVYEDSCVEFFVSPDSDGSYYNIEFNCIGTCLMGYGIGRDGRKLAEKSVISQIRRLPSVGKLPFMEREGSEEWSLTVAIPFTAFFRHDVKYLKGRTLTANFYKCGDMLSVPHYLTWSRLDTENPDFHQPEYFGELLFE